MTAAEVVMIYKLNQMSPGQIYHVMTQTIIPRPVAWILTENAAIPGQKSASYNLAPFSFFNGISSDPPILMVSIGIKDNGKKKDSWINIEERDHFVVHIPSLQQADSVKATSEEFDYGISETEQLDIKLVPFETAGLPRLQDCPVAFYCKKINITEIGNEPQAMILGSIEAVYISDDVSQFKNNRLITDPLKINPLMRLGAGQFGSLGDVFK